MSGELRWSYRGTLTHSFPGDDFSAPKSISCSSLGRRLREWREGKTMWDFPHAIKQSAASFTYLSGATTISRRPRSCSRLDALCEYWSISRRSNSCEAVSIWGDQSKWQQKLMYETTRTLSKHDVLSAQSSLRNSILNATRGEALHSEEMQEIMRLATTGGIMQSHFDEPRALVGRLAATVITELPTCLLRNDPTVCFKLLSSAISVIEPIK